MPKNHKQKEEADDEDLEEDTEDKPAKKENTPKKQPKEKHQKDTTPKRRGIVGWIIVLVLVIASVLVFFLLPLFTAIGLVFIIFLPIILYILIYKWLKRWFASLFFSTILWILIVIAAAFIFGRVVINDVSQYAQTIQNNPQYVLLTDNGNTFFATRIDSLDQIQQTNGEEGYHILSNKEILDLQKELSPDLENKAVFVINKDTFRNVKTIEISSFTFSREEAFGVLTEIDESRFELLGISLDQAKISVFAALMQSLLEQNDISFLIEEVKKGNIQVYPKNKYIEEFLKVVPTSMLSGFIPPVQ